MTTDTTNSNAVIACSRCKREFPSGKLGRMARLPLALGCIFHLTPGDEGERFYCPRCRSSQNFCMIGLVAIGCAGLAGYWSSIAAGVIMLVWLAGSCLWLLFCVCRAVHRRVTGKHIERTKTL